MNTHEIKPATYLENFDVSTLWRLALVKDFGAAIIPKPSRLSPENIEEIRRFAAADVLYPVLSHRERRFFNVAAMQNGSTDSFLQSIPPVLKELIYLRTRELTESTGQDYSKWRLHFNQAKTLFVDWHFDDRIKGLYGLLQLPGDRRMRYFQAKTSNQLTIRNYAAYGNVRTRNQDARDFISQRTQEEIKRLDELDTAFFNCHFLHASGTEPSGMTITIGLDN